MSVGEKFVKSAECPKCGSGNFTTCLEAFAQNTKASAMCNQCEHEFEVGMILFVLPTCPTCNGVGEIASGVEEFGQKEIIGCPDCRGGNSNDKL